MGVSVREKTKGSGEWWVFIKHNGKRRSKKVSRDRRVAMGVAKKIEARLVLGDFGILDEPQKVLSFGEYADLWITVTVPATCKKSTASDYSAILKNHVLPEFGNMQVDEIKKSDIKTFLMRKYKTGLSESKIKHLKSVISGVLNLAVDDEALIVNPAHRIGKLFRKNEVRKEIRPLTREELSILLKTFIEQYSADYPLCLLLSRTGMRIGEAMALKWSDVDFDKRVITVRRNINKFGDVDTPKSAKSRKVDMSLQLRAVLQHLAHDRKVQKLKAGWKNAPEWVFVNSEGRRLDKNNWRNRVFYAAVKSAGLRKVRIHDLRHTFASLLIQAGQSLAYIRDQMGHHSIQVTVDIYGHLVPGGNKDAVDGLDDIDFCAPRGTLSAP